LASRADDSRRQFAPVWTLLSFGEVRRYANGLSIPRGRRLYIFFRGYFGRGFWEGSTSLLSARIVRRDDGSFYVRKRFRFSHFQCGLTAVSGFGGIGAHFQIGSFNEITPAFVAIRRRLRLFQIFQFRLGVLLALEDFNNAGGQVRPDVVPDDGVGTTLFVACQRESISIKVSKS
jgi:hypothetical protein